MKSSEGYKETISELTDEVRSITRLEDNETVLISALAIIWGAYKYELIDIKSNDIKEEIINQAITIIKVENKDFKDVFTELLTYKIEKKEDRIELVQNIFKVLKDKEDISLEYIKNIINYTIKKLDMVRGGSISATPDSVKELIIKMIEPTKEMKIADYFSGLGGTLLKVKKAYGDYNIKLYGEELNNEVYLLSQILLLVNEVNDYNIINKDVYDFKGVKENEFDYVIMDGPLGPRLKETLEKNKILSYGIPNKTRVEWASYQLALYSLKTKGRAIVTGSTGVLFRISDKKIKKGIIEDDRIEAIIKLPASLYRHTSLPIAIIVFNKSKTIDKKDKIMFIDASKEYTRKDRGQNIIPENSIKKIIESINENMEIEDFSISVDIDMVVENEYNLNSNVYLNEKKIKNKLDKTRILSEVAEIKTGVQLSKKDMKILKKDPTHYYLNIKNIEDGEIIYNEDEKIRDKNIDWYGKYDIKAGDIIITTKGTTTKMLVVENDFNESFISNNLSIIRVNQKEYNPYVLLKYLKSDIGKLVLENITSGSVVRVIGANKLKGIEIPDYDMDLMNSVGERIKKNERDYKLKLAELEKDFNVADQEIMNELGIE